MSTGTQRTCRSRGRWRNSSSSPARCVFWASTPRILTGASRRPGRVRHGALLVILGKLRFDFVYCGRLIFLEQIAGSDKIDGLLARHLDVMGTLAIPARKLGDRESLPSREIAAGVVDRGDFRRRQRDRSREPKRQSGLKRRNTADRHAVGGALRRPERRSIQPIHALEFVRDRLQRERSVQRE